MSIEKVLSKYKSVIKETDISINNDLTFDNATIVNIESVYKNNQDKFNYFLVELANSLKIFFVHDKTTILSGAQMRIGTGHFSDPKNGDGLAHFLEHMLFMGSTKYPDASLFMPTVDTNGGGTNAFTASTETQYFFSVKSDKFLDVLDIFSRFFIDPLFDVEYVEKELEAIDGEHQKNIGNDSWRKNMLIKKFLGAEKYKKFGTGSKQNLLEFANGDHELLREKLIEFWKKYYVANNMFLVIYHNDIDSATINSIARMFVSIATGNYVPYRSDRHMMNYCQNAYEIILMEGLYTHKTLDLMWLVNGNLKFDKTNLDNKSLIFILYVLGSETNGSLYDILTKLGYISMLHAGFDEFTDDHSMFTLGIMLTDLGLEHYTNILYIVHNYIENLLKEYSNKEIFLKLFEEAQSINFLAFTKYAQPTELDLIEQIAEIYAKTGINMKYALVHQLMIGNVDIIYKHFLNFLGQLKIDRMKVICCSQLFKNTKNVEKYYGTHYDFLQRQINFDRCLPKVLYTIPVFNLFIPTEVQILNTEASTHMLPYIKMSSKSSNIFYLQHKNTYEMTTCIIEATVELPEKETKDVIRYLLIMLYINYVNHEARSFFDMIQTATYGFIIYPNSNGTKLNIMISGHPHKIDEVVQKCLDMMFAPDLSIPMNKRIYEIVVSDYESYIYNVQYAAPNVQLNDEISNILHTATNISYQDIQKHLGLFSRKALSDSNNKINFKNFRQIALRCMKFGNIKCIMGGSITPTIATTIASQLERQFGDLNTREQIQYDPLPNNKIDTLTCNNLNKANKNNAIMYGIHLGTTTTASLKNYYQTDWMLMTILCMFAHLFCQNKFFKEFRTENGTGYIARVRVHSETLNYNTESFLCFILQTHKDKMIEKIEQYAEKLKNMLVELSDDEYNEIIAAIRVKVEDKFDNLHQEISCFYNNGILLRKYEPNEVEKFDRKARLIEFAKTIQKSTITARLISAFNNGYRFVINVVPAVTMVNFT